MPAWNCMAHSLKQKSSPRWWIQPLWFPAAASHRGKWPLSRQICQQNLNWVKVNKGLCQFTVTKLLSNPLHLKFSTDPISSYELIILLILLEKISFGNLMAKPKQLILQTTTQNLDQNSAFANQKPTFPETGLQHSAT